jgi:Holliday junction resolvase RusA-like endonuclease
MSNALLVFEVPGEPVGKGRPIVGRSFGGGHPVLRTPSKTIRYESDIAVFAAQAMAGRPLLEGPLWMHVTAFFARPKSQPKKNPPIWVTKKPDSSNILKAAEDALNGVAYVDDVQIADSRIVRRFCDDNRPRLVVSIGKLDDAGQPCQSH